MTCLSQAIGSQYKDPNTSTLKSEPCILVIFGATGDLCKRLLIPSLYNLACDNLLAENFAILGTATRPIDSEEFRNRMRSETDGLKKFHTRPEFDPEVSEQLIERISYLAGSFDDLEHFYALKKRVSELSQQYHTDNILFYFATAPSFFGMLCKNLYQAGFQQGDGWRRIILEKPFGRDLKSAQALNDEVLSYWKEENIYRIDHYLGKETVQNLLAFRFANGIYEPLWNKYHIDNIQFNVCETVDIGSRGGYYDKSGVLRDMMQNHMFQMLAYLCMEPPSSFEANAIRNEKAKLLDSVRIYQQDEIEDISVRGQYGPLIDSTGDIIKPGYRQEEQVDPQSSTETFAALKLNIDNWRWEGVPIYLRSGKALWKRGTEIVVEFKKAPEPIFRGTDVKSLDSNRLVFHIQPYQGIEFLFQAKTPGPTMQLQKVDMQFNYGDAFKASLYTGYEVMLFACTHGDATLFSRNDLVEGAWRIAQPILDYWEKHPVTTGFPNYPRNSWGPKAARDFIAKDGRKWYESITTEVLERTPLFKGADTVLLNSIIMALNPLVVDKNDIIIQQGEQAGEMYFICQGEVDILQRKECDIVELKEWCNEKKSKTLVDGDYFGEIALLSSSKRTATVLAKSQTDLLVLKKEDFAQIIRNNPQFADAMIATAKERYNLTISPDDLMCTIEYDESI